MYRVGRALAKGLSGAETAVEGAPGVGWGAAAGSGGGLGHRLLGDAGVADVGDGAHVFHPVLGERTAVLLKGPHLLERNKPRILILLVDQNSDQPIPH